MVKKEIVELAEKIKKYRINVKLVKELKTKKEALEKQVVGLEKSLKILKLNTIKKNSLLRQIKELEINQQKLKLDLDKSREAYTFVVTTPGVSTVYGEISRELSKAQQEILICSPWITHIIEELSRFKKRGKKMNLKIITRLIKEDIDIGITDLNKLGILEKTFGAEIRYNNNLHAKIVVTDNSVAIISSANLTKKGLSVNYEAGICLRDKNTVDEVAQFFNEVWEESNPLTLQAIKDVQSNKNG